MFEFISVKNTTEGEKERERKMQNVERMREKARKKENMFKK